MISRRLRLTAAARLRARAAARTLTGIPARIRSDPTQAGRVLAAFLIRWVLRLGLPIAGAAAMLNLFPKYVTAGGISFKVQGSLFRRTGISADTSVGSWQFPHVDGLPVGVHISPVNVDVVDLASRAGSDPAGYGATLHADLSRQLPMLIAWLVGEVVVGIGLGLLVAVAINLAVRQLRGLPRRPDELRRRVRQGAAAAAVVVVVALVGAVTYDPGWTRRSRLTGTLAALQLFPSQLQGYYDEHSKAGDVLAAIGAIQTGLQSGIDTAQVPATAFNIMFISDMHLASTYPLVAQYARNFDVALIVNTGDEAEFGTREEMTPAYLAQLRAVTQVAPMLWLPGNHDSPATVQVMRTVPGVTVLGTKTDDGRGGIAVTGQQIDAYGLDIGAVPDPRVYGGNGVYGSNDPDVTKRLQQGTVRAALAGVPKTARWDILATHEPTAMDELERQVGDRVRQLDGGHRHAQNPDDEIQRAGRPIYLDEGSTGAGGLDNLGKKPPPIEFSVESVSDNCQFTKVVRFQVDPSAVTDPSALPQVSSTTRYLSAQSVGADRQCRLSVGLGAPVPLGS